MTSQRFQRVREIYHAALDRPSDQREVFLEQVCSGDAGLRQEVHSLLAAQAEAGTFMVTTPDAALDTQPAGPCRGTHLPAVFSVHTKFSPRWAPGVWVKFISPATSGWNEV